MEVEGKGISQGQYRLQVRVITNLVSFISPVATTKPTIKPVKHMEVSTFAHTPADQYDKTLETLNLEVYILFIMFIFTFSFRPL